MAPGEASASAKQQGWDCARVASIERDEELLEPFGEQLCLFEGWLLWVYGLSQSLWALFCTPGWRLTFREWGLKSSRNIKTRWAPRSNLWASH